MFRDESEQAEVADKMPRARSGALQRRKRLFQTQPVGEGAEGVGDLVAAADGAAHDF